MVSVERCVRERAIFVRLAVVAGRAGMPGADRPAGTRQDAIFFR